MVLSTPKAKLSAKGSAKKIVSPAYLKHAIQFEKLQQKSALQTAAMDGIRQILRQKAVLERDCAASVEKLLTQHSSRKDITQYFDLLHSSVGVTSNNAVNGDSQSLTLAELWRNTIAEMLKLQGLKIAACDEVIKRTSPDDAKSAKLSRSMQVKRGVDVVLEIQHEIDCVADRVTQSKKTYTDSETIVQDTHKKIKKLEDKGKKALKPTKIPEKLTTLLSAESPKATAARNEYLLSVAGANAFLTQYYSHDIPYIINIMNGDMYDSMASTLTSIFEAEHRLVPHANQFYENLLHMVNQLDNSKDIESFVSAQPSLKEPFTYSFEPVEGDMVSVVSTTSDPELTMDKCARKWTLRFVEGETAQNKLLQQWESITSQVALETLEGKAALDAKMFTLQESLRRAATYQKQAKNILDALRQAKVDVDKWMYSAKQAMEQKQLNSDGPEIITSLPPQTPWHNNRPGVDPESADNKSAAGVSVTDSGSAVSADAIGSSSSRRCVALYDYTSDRPDELSFVADQELKCLSGSTGDEWLLVEDDNGQQGYIPANYVAMIEINDDRSYAVSDTDRNPADTGYSNGFASRDDWNDPTPTWGDASGYSHDPEKSAIHGSFHGMADRPTADIEVSVDGQDYENSYSMESADEASGYCRALYDYTADELEDLSFQEGDIIRIISRTSNSGVDDGFWTGELNGMVGMFMAALTEEIANLHDIKVNGSNFQYE